MLVDGWVARYRDHHYPYARFCNEGDPTKANRNCRSSFFAREVPSRLEEMVFGQGNTGRDTLLARRGCRQPLTRCRWKVSNPGSQTRIHILPLG